MKYLFLSILMIGVGIGVVGCEDDDKDDNIIEINGLVFGVASSADALRSSFAYLIESTNGVIYDPQNSLPEEHRIEGLAVWVRAEELETTSSWSRVINIIEIERR